MSTATTAGPATLLDRVAWPAVHQMLQERASDAVRALCADHAPQGRFAVLVLTESRHVLSRVLRLHQAGPWPLQLVDSERLATWLAETAHIGLPVWAAMTPRWQGTVQAALDPPRPDQPAGVLHVDDELTGLPLLDVARELAAQLGGHHHVRVATLPPGMSGWHAPRLRVDIDVAQAGDALHRAWLHEFGHALDTGADRTGEQRETFADTLGELLATHAPATLADTAPLVDQADQHVRSLAEQQRDQRGYHALAGGLVPEPGRDSVLAFLCLPLTSSATPATE